MNAWAGKIAVPVILLSVQAFCQDSTLVGSLTVSSNVAGAGVYVDSALVGPAPVRGVPVTADTHTVCVVVPGVERWIASSCCETIVVHSGQHVELVLDLPHQFRVTSEPYGAQVVMGDSVLGQTPFVFSTRLAEGSVTLVKEGYESLTLVFAPSTPYLYGMLVPTRQTADPSALYLVREESNSIMPIVVSASSAVLSGAAAAYFKIRADNLYSDYQATGNTANLNRVQQLDIASGVALGICQISLAALSYFLLSR